MPFPLNSAPLGASVIRGPSCTNSNWGRCRSTSFGRFTSTPMQFSLQNSLPRKSCLRSGSINSAKDPGRSIDREARGTTVTCHTLTGKSMLISSFFRAQPGALRLCLAPSSSSPVADIAIDGGCSRRTCLDHSSGVSSFHQMSAFDGPNVDESVIVITRFK